MLTLFYGPGACSMASHIVLEESGEKYEPKKMDLAKGEQRSESYLKMNPQGRVPCLQLDNGEYLSENTAILPYLGKRFGAWPKDGTAEAKAMSLIGFFAASYLAEYLAVDRTDVVHIFAVDGCYPLAANVVVIAFAVIDDGAFGSRSCVQGHGACPFLENTRIIGGT